MRFNDKLRKKVFWFVIILPSSFIFMKAIIKDVLMTIFKRKMYISWNVTFVKKQNCEPNIYVQIYLQTYNNIKNCPQKWIHSLKFKHLSISNRWILVIWDVSLPIVSIFSLQIKSIVFLSTFLSYLVVQNNSLGTESIRMLVLILIKVMGSNLIQSEPSILIDPFNFFTFSHSSFYYICYISFQKPCSYWVHRTSVNYSMYSNLLIKLKS